MPCRIDGVAIADLCLQEYVAVPTVPLTGQVDLMRVGRRRQGARAGLQQRLECLGDLVERTLDLAHGGLQRARILRSSFRSFGHRGTGRLCAKL